MDRRPLPRGCDRSTTIGLVEPTITDAAAAHRYEARIDGDLAGVLEYVTKRDRIALVHTEVFPEHQGRGIAERLAAFALDDARRRGLRVIPICPYVRAYLERHPEDQDLVAGVTPA
jgi:uncharacterized protein